MMDDDNGFGVIFDMDGVLVDSAGPHFTSWQLLAEENGGSVTREQFSSTFGRQNDDIIPILFGEVGPAQRRRLADRKEELYRELYVRTLLLSTVPSILSRRYSIWDIDWASVRPVPCRTSNSSWGRWACAIGSP